MKLKKGYIYQLPEEHVQSLSLRWANVGVIKRDWYTIDGPSRKLTLVKGYAWNGASGIPDDVKVIRGSAVHDVFYQEMRLGGLDPTIYRNKADLELQDICVNAGMSTIRAWVIYTGVRMLAGFAVNPSQEPSIIEVP